MNYEPIWTCALLWCRFGGILFALPGIGGDHGKILQTLLSAALAACLVLGGINNSPLPEGLMQAGLMVGSELLLGWVLGMVPQLLIGGLSVAGQIIAGSIGLGQANMMDHSLGGQVSVLSLVQSQIAVIIFLMMNGHHVVIRVAARTIEDVSLGAFRPEMNTAMVLLDRFVVSFELALMVSAPIIVTTLLTQFILGLITKFVPQMNVFIISLPLNVLVGLFITAYTYAGLAEHVLREFSSLEEYLGRIVLGGVP